MARFLALPFLLVTLAAASPTPNVEVVTGDLSQLPALQSRNYNHLNSKVVVRIWELAHTRICTIPGYSLGALDFRMSFAAQYNRDGSIARVVLPKLDCPEAEGILGGALVEMIQGGDYRPKARSEKGWYQGKLTFGFQGGRGS